MYMFILVITTQTTVSTTTQFISSISSGTVNSKITYQVINMKSKRGTEGNLKEVDAVCQLGNAIGVCAEMY